jgi:hypothetical protein
MTVEEYAKYASMSTEQIFEAYGTGWGVEF